MAAARLDRGHPPEETLDELYENAPCGYLTADGDGVIVRVNATLLAWLGCSRDATIGQRVHTLLSPAGRIFFEMHVAPSIETAGAAHQVAIDLRCADGRRFHALSDWRRVDRDGQPVGIRAMLVDATDRRAYERDLIEARERAQVAVLQLSDSEARLREANETLERRVEERTNELRDTRDFARLALSAVGGVGVWTFEVEPDCFFCDASVAKLYDIDPGEAATGISSKRFLANVHPDDRATLAATMASGLLSAGDLELEYRLIHRDGSVHWVLSRGHTYFDEQGNPIRRTGVGVDMTKQRQTEDQLRQAQKMEAVGQLTGGIAHDFNNLLQGITGSLDIVRARLDQGRTTDLDRWLKGAQTSAERAAALTHRLLAFSRRQPLDPRAVRANPLIQSMEDLLRRTLGEQIEFTSVLADDLWLTRCDPNQLESAILNLVINARDAMPDGGRLIVGTSNAEIGTSRGRHQDLERGQYVCIAVTDTGTGMNADTVSRAFEPFFTTKPTGQGTGLGLSMIYGFARQSDGHAKIHSEIGRGTTIELYLPRHRGDEEVDQTDLVPDPVRAQHSGETVLVVEDEPTVRSLIVEVLSELGYLAIEAADGPSGLKILQSGCRIDLLVTDIGLPGLNGRQVADAARVTRPDLKVLFMTGYAETASLASGFLEAGMTMITKPFAMDVLATRIRDIIKDGDHAP